MSGQLSPTTLLLVEQTLNESRGMKPSEVHRALGGFGSLITVRHALRELCQQGRAKHQGPDMSRHYFRVHDPVGSARECGK